MSVLADAIVLNSLCKMFGLLDSVKQALDLKRCQEGENKIHNGNYSKMATCVMSVCGFYSAGVRKGFFSIFLYLIVLDEILDDQRKQGRIKSTSCRMKPFKQPDPLCHSEQNKSSELLSQVRPSPGIQPPFAAPLSSSSFGQLPINPQLHARVRGALENRKEASGIRRELGQRTVKLNEDLHLRSEETGEACSVRDIEKMVIGRKVSKKHKSK